MAGIPEKRRSLNIGELLETQRMAGSMTDVTLVCEGKEFPAHKMILYTVSEYFRTLFKEGWNENKSGRIELPTVTVAEMEVILPCLYTGKIKLVEDPTLLKMLLKTSHMMQIQTLFEYCYEKLEEKISCKSFFEVFNLHEVYNNKNVSEVIVTFLAENFEAISRNDDFLKLTDDQLKKVIHYLDAWKTSMDDVINGLLRWTKAEENREDTFLDILTNIDLPMMSTDFLMELLHERALFKKSFHILTLLTAEATRRVLRTASSLSLENADDPKLLCFGALEDRKVLSTFDIKQNKWSTSKTVPFKLDNGMSTVWFGGCVYFIGGRVDGRLGSLSSQVLEYNPATNVVVSEGQLLIPVCRAGAGVLHKSIYIVNGYSENLIIVRTVQRYIPATNTCEIVAETNTCHTQPHVLTFGSYLYVVGSWEDQNCVERYDHKTNAWTTITNIPGSFTSSRAAILQDKLFVISSSENSNELQVYDFTWGTWVQEEIQGLPNSIWGLHAAVLNGKFILLVRDSKKVLHFYDEVAKQWLRKSAANKDPWWADITCVA